MSWTHQVPGEVRGLLAGGVAESITLCDGCGSYRLTREYKGLKLCINGSHCYRHRRSIVKKGEKG